MSSRNLDFSLNRIGIGVSPPRSVILLSVRFLATHSFEQELLTFLNANPEFDFKHERLESYLAGKPGALQGEEGRNEKLHKD